MLLYVISVIVGVDDCIRLFANLFEQFVDGVGGCGFDCVFSGGAEVFGAHTV